MTTHSTPALVTWVVLALVLGLVLGAAVATLVVRRPGRRRAPADAPPAPEPAPPPAPGARRALEVDDLPAFLEHPPGSPGPAPEAPAPRGAPTAAPASGATAVGATRGGAAGPARRPRSGRHSPGDDLSARSTVLAMVATALVLVLVAVVVALAGRAGDDGDPAPAPTPTAAAPPDGPTAPTGSDARLAARAAFGTVLLERRAVGVTVTRPGLSARSDRGGAVASVLLPTYNCLLREPPPDPEAAGCARAATEYADLATPDLRITRVGDRVELAGHFTTYTQPPTGPPAYTGRSYELSATLTAAGPALDGAAPASGVLRLGDASAPTTADPGANVLELRG